MFPRLKSNPKRFTNRLGMSLVEIMLATGIILMVVVPLAGAVLNGIKGAVNFANSNKALQLAQELMEEIKRKKWDETTPVFNGPPNGDLAPGPPYSLIGRDGLGGETNPDSDGSNAAKLTWDDIDDYSGLVEKPAKDISNNPILGAERFTRLASVYYVDVAGGTVAEPPAVATPFTVSASVPSTNYKMVKIIVSWDGMTGEPVTISTILSNVKKY